MNGLIIFNLQFTIKENELNIFFIQSVWMKNYVTYKVYDS